MAHLRLLFLALLVAGLSALAPAWNATSEWAEPENDGWMFNGALRISDAYEFFGLVYSKQTDHLYVLGRQQTVTTGSAGFFQIVSMDSPTAIPGAWRTTLPAGAVGETALIYTGIAVDYTSSINSKDVIYTVGYSGTVSFYIVVYRYHINWAAPDITQINKFSVNLASRFVGAYWLRDDLAVNSGSDNRATAVAVHPTLGNVYVSCIVDNKAVIVRYLKTDIEAEIATGVVAPPTSATLSTTYTGGLPVTTEKIAVTSAGVFVTGVVQRTGHQDFFVYAMSLDLSSLLWHWPPAGTTDTSINTGKDDRPSSITVSVSDVLVVGTRNGTYTTATASGDTWSSSSPMGGVFTEGSTFMAKFPIAGATPTWSELNVPPYVSGDAVDMVSAVSGPMPTSGGTFYMSGYSQRTAGSGMAHDRIFVQSFGSDWTTAPTISPSYTRLMLSTNADEGLPYSSAAYSAVSSLTPYRSMMKAIVTVPNRRSSGFGSDSIFVAGSLLFLSSSTVNYLPVVIKLVTPPRKFLLIFLFLPICLHFLKYN